MHSSLITYCMYIIIYAYICIYYVRLISYMMVLIMYLIQAVERSRYSSSRNRKGEGKMKEVEL